jgi:hypothetical protein
VDTVKAASRLRSLAADIAKRSKTAVLRDVFPEIETAIRAGVSQVVILDELRLLGFEMNQHAFRSALRRLRAERATGQRSLGSLGRTDFSPVSTTGRATFGSTISPGAMYDAEALSRLIRASQRVPA